MDVTTTQMCEDLLRFLRHFKTVAAELADQHGLTLVQMSAVSAIGRQGELPMGKVADALHCDASNVTGIVDRLVAQGLVERKECPQDRRAKTLQLTSRGTHIVDTLNRLLPEALGCHILTDKERVQLHDLLFKICEPAS